MPLLKKARSTNTPRFLDYLVTWQSEFARVPPRAPEPLNTGTLGTRLYLTLGHIFAKPKERVKTNQKTRV